MSRYDIDFKKLVAEILAPKKRKTKRITFIYRLLAWFRKIHAEFVLLQTELEYQGKITSQVIIFESYLNDLFGDGITIEVKEIETDLSWIADNEDDEFAFDIADDEDSDIGTFIGDNEAADTTNFIVNIPASLNADLTRIGAIIEHYMMPGASYQLVES